MTLRGKFIRRSLHWLDSCYYDSYELNHRARGQPFLCLWPFNTNQCLPVIPHHVFNWWKGKTIQYFTKKKAENSKKNQSHFVKQNWPFILFSAVVIISRPLRFTPGWELLGNSDYRTSVWMPKKPPTLQSHCAKRVYGTTLVTLVRLLIVFA